MKWFKRKPKVKKRDEKGTYYTLDHGRVVPVTGNEKKPLPEESRPQYKEEDEEPNLEESKSPKWVKWLWLIVILGLGYGTIQLMGGLATENKQNFQLQEIQRNTLQALEDPGKALETPKTETKPTKEVDSPSETVGSTSIGEKASQWKEEIKNGFTHEKSSKTEESTEKTAGESADRTLLFDIRALDEMGTQHLETIRDASVSYINGDISRGQYLLRIKSVELKVKRYSNEIALMNEHIQSTPSYSTLMEYVGIKRDGLESLTTEIRVTDIGNVASLFNGYVDTHNDISKEADKEFVQQLKELGYEAKIKNGIIQYQQ
ncbi:hypothetical protein [Rossellomorea marisflavi]|uniref:hypothetical protein n=1 Tax=Rossellomorea marisflavi TaxID=189381 RepID=UPI003FA1525C